MTMNEKNLTTVHRTGCEQRLGIGVSLVGDIDA